MCAARDFSALADAFMSALAGVGLPGRGAGGVVRHRATGLAPQRDATLEVKELAQFYRDRARDYVDEREYKYSAPVSPFARAAASYSRRRLSSRAVGYERGLSNAAYLAATSGARKISLSCSAAGVRFACTDPLHGLRSSAPSPVGGRRGKIEELSDDSKRRMGAFAYGLTARGHKPELFITLTAPANWQEIYLENGEETGGRIFKRQMFAFKRRLDRKLYKMGIVSWAGFWFLEFQRRGAPHLHLYVFNCEIKGWQFDELRAWAGSAWAEIVGNNSELEYAKHEKAGTSVERVRKKHFGYAAKYSKKESQKDVPLGFRDVGRFWGRWGVSRETPIKLEYELNFNNKKQVLDIEEAFIKAVRVIYEKSPSFAARVFIDFANFIRGQKVRTTFTLFGNDCTSAWLEALGSPPIDWNEL